MKEETTSKPPKKKRVRSLSELEEDPIEEVVEKEAKSLFFTKGYWNIVGQNGVHQVPTSTLTIPDVTAFVIQGIDECIAKIYSINPNPNPIVINELLRRKAALMNTMINIAYLRSQSILHRPNILKPSASDQ